MTVPRILALALAALLTGTVAALETPSTIPAPAPATAAPAQPTPHDCGAAARHDHGAERGTMAPRTGACLSAAPRRP